MKRSVVLPIALACLAVLLCGGCSIIAPASSTPEPTALPVASAEVITFADTSAPSQTPQLTPTPSAPKAAAATAVTGTTNQAAASADI